MIILIILIIVLLLSFSYIKKLFKNEPIILDDVKLREEEPKKKGFALMLEQDDGTYKESSSSTWPTDMVFNSELSGCIDMNGNTIENSLSYTASTNSIKIRTNSTVYCYVYFDKKIPSITLTVSTDGTSSILPTYNHYKQTLTCDGGTTSTFNTKYQRLEISNVSNTNTKCYLNYTKDTSTYTLLKTKVESDNTTDNNGYRYSGKEPNNWVWFNNEKWRIIGSIPVCMTSGCGESDTRLVKIIRNESIGGLAYDAKSSGYTGAWGSNTLYSLLNNYYYGKSNGTNTDYCYGFYNSTYQPKPNCNYSDIGISSSGTDYYGRMVKEVYWNTGAISTGVTVSKAYTSEIVTQTVRGRIGLMSASDYGYAGTDYTNAMSSPAFANNTNTNWLYGQSNEWTSIQYSSHTDAAFLVNVIGYVYGGYAYVASAVRPVLYLDSSVYIISGNGTESSPYVLGM